MRHIKIDKQKVRDIDLSNLGKYSTVDGPDFSEAGIEAYKLYAHMSELINDSTIVEVGTRYGKSALALSYNDFNKVLSFDIMEQGASSILRQNISFIVDNFMEYDVDWENVDMIMIDVDPHDGIKEREFLTFLESVGWEGILILDDILPNWPVIIPGANPTEMYNWWNSLEYEKYDVSDVGHFSGTGIVNIGNKFTIEIC